jgi:hypothetical protein
VVRADPVPFAVGDVVRLKKPHPCGAVEWTIVRIGADIGMKCHGCGRRVLLPRRDLERRMKLLQPRENPVGATDAPPTEAARAADRDD